MPNEFPANLYYHVDYDQVLPDEIKSKRNIILTIKGMEELAEYYKEKYDIDIDIITESIYSNTFDNDFIALLEKARKAAATQKTARHGFIIFNVSAGEHGHAQPVIWEKDGENENLFLFGSFGRLPDQEDVTKLSRFESKKMKFREEILKMSPSIHIWSPLRGTRQVDMSSCTIDTLAILKDGLRMSPSLAATSKSKFIEKKCNVNLFHLPEELLKTTQAGSYLNKSAADTNKVVHRHHVKNQNKQHTGAEQSVTLGDFRSKYDVDIVKHIHITSDDPKEKDKVINKIVKFNTFTLFKGRRFEKILEQRWAMKQHREIIVLMKNLAMLLTSDDIKSANNDLLAKINSESSYIARKALIHILDFIVLAQNSPGNFPPETVTHSEQVTELMLKLFNDISQPNFRENLDQFLKIGRRDAEYKVVEFGKQLMSQCNKAEHSITRLA